MTATRLWRLAVSDVEEFRTLCERLRKLGVVKLGPLVLGPLPAAVVDRAAKKEVDPQEAIREHYKVAFAASSITPPLPEPKTSNGHLPRAVVQRRQAQEARRGGTDPKDS